MLWIRFSTARAASAFRKAWDWRPRATSHHCLTVQSEVGQGSRFTIDLPPAG